MGDNKPVSLRVTVRYAVPPRATVLDCLDTFRSANWVGDIVRHVVPYLKTQTNQSVLDAIESQEIPGGGEDCVVCMRIMDAAAASLPCGHLFHASCICAWLRVCNTCPTCRSPVPSQFSGRYAFRKITTTLVVHDLDVPKEALTAQDVGGRDLMALVDISLSVEDGDGKPTFPCELNAAVTTSALVA
ncbi:unnamed protein product [Aphanomyces euteiches]|uniref:RING-type domain-containing protein n=1 Tax=Aphanomyces euteiches TaxID=100861 RepID=A0A6G0W653_9STRA|nr:hypothetical protein Ae201684_018549 [Aphanomyces euteiches]KAH9079820.1 hypothetical protein Ae201684P_007496 [Aphanomyces euteiches]KAH9151010.1 hypothetical protein AeRB84_006275 [Aphanomyces euteiches]